MAKNAMTRQGCRVIALACDQFATPQQFERRLDGALRQTGFFRERTQTGRDRLPFGTRGLSVEIDIDQIRGRLAIVADDVAHQNVHDVIVNRDGFAKARHGKSDSGYLFGSPHILPREGRDATIRPGRSEALGGATLLFIVGVAEEEFHCVIKGMIHEDNRVVFLGRGWSARMT